MSDFGKGLYPDNFAGAPEEFLNSPAAFREILALEKRVRELERVVLELAQSSPSVGSISLDPLKAVAQKR